MGVTIYDHWTAVDPQRYHQPITYFPMFSLLSLVDTEANYINTIAHYNDNEVSVN
jgi:hypothetical protein